MLALLRRWLIGAPLATAQAVHERLSKPVALAVLSADALSSVAYATEEILLVLAVASQTNTAAFDWVIPITLGIVALLWIVVISYRQTIYAYPSGGGAYIVARENLGTTPALTAGAALLVDYTLTVSVSVASGVAAVTSAVQGTPLAWLAGHPVALCLLGIAFITLVNLRGVRESGSVFAVPVYLFIFSFLSMIAWGLACDALSDWQLHVQPEGTPKFAEGYESQPLNWLLLLGAFSGGCTAMTGVEAISNGVPAFRQPESRNASLTLLWMASLLTALFLGTSTLAWLYHAQPRQEETVISEFARVIFPGRLSWAYYLVQAATAAILVLAANTSFADFPRLASLMGRDGFLPRQFADRGDRLVYSNGIVALAVLAGLLVWVFRGDVSRLIPLYAIGVFLSFTLSQAGMVCHWWRLGHEAVPEGQRKPSWWRTSLVVNALGAMVTAGVLAVFVLTKFRHGAWIVVVVLPLLVLLFSAIGRHYRRIAKQLALDANSPLLVCPPLKVLVPVQRVHRGVREALGYAQCLSKDVVAVYVEVEPADTEEVRKGWEALGAPVPLEVLPSPYREYVSVLVEHVERVRDENRSALVNVVMPEFVPPAWWQEALHNGWVIRLKAALLYQPGIVVTSVPFVLPEEEGESAG